MPKLPKGMLRKGRGHYARKIVRGKQYWFSLGTDYEVACERLREFRQEGPPATAKSTVEDASRRWLASYIATTRTGKGPRLAAARVDKYLKPFMGGKRIGPGARYGCALVPAVA